MWSFQTTGLLTPAPARGTFQRTLVVADHSSGRFFSAEMPRLSGPRQPGQSSAREAGVAASNRMMARRFMFPPSPGLGASLHREPFARRIDDAQHELPVGLRIGRRGLTHLDKHRVLARLQLDRK